MTVEAASFDPTGEVSTRLRDEASGWNLDGTCLEKYEPYIVCGIHLGSGPYAHTSIDAQVHIAKYTLVLLCVDELEIPNSALEEFMERLYSGHSQLHPMLDILVHILQDMKLFWSTFLVTQIVKSTVDFINSVVLDEKIETMSLRPSSLPFVKFKRFYNGIGEAYTAFIWDKDNFPDLCSYIQALPSVFPTSTLSHVTDSYNRDINIFCDYVK